MTFADMLTELETRGALAASRVKDYRTSLRYLAEALDLGSPALASVDASLAQESAWLPKLETYFATLDAKREDPLSPITKRNTRNNLRTVFREAAAHGLLSVPLASRLLVRPRKDDWLRDQRASSPFDRSTGPRHYGLPCAQWPSDIAQGFAEYKVKKRLKTRMRDTTFASYVTILETYFGYVAHIVGKPPVWDDLFDVARVMAYVDWHAARHARPLTAHARQVALVLASMAAVMEHPARPALLAYSKTLKVPPHLHNKDDYKIPLVLLEEAADACLAEGRAPLITRDRKRVPGARRAVMFQYGLIIKILIRTALRQRNIREMRVGRHLIQNLKTKHWRLSFVGDDLKISHRGEAVNTHQIALTQLYPELAPLLTEWFGTYRLKIPNAAATTLVFLTQYGTPYNARTLGRGLSLAVGPRIGRHFYPHLARTLRATEYLDANNGDYRGAATILNDLPATVARAYDNKDIEKQHAKAADSFHKAMAQGTGASEAADAAD